MSDSEEEVNNDLSNPDVTTKYQAASVIINKALQLVIDACQDGASVCELCQIGDKYIDAECGKLYNKKEKKKEGDKDDKPAKKMEKGVASPTCVSVNEIAGHFSPLKAEDQELKNGNVVKIDMACHFDGFVAAVAHTIIVGDEEISDSRANCIHAAWAAAEAALRLVQVGTKNTAVTPMFQKVADEFKCQPLEGVQSHEMKKHVIHGNRVVPMKANVDEKVEEFEFKVNEVYCIDVMMSTGEGKVRQTELRSTVWKRAVENNYQLKTAKGRQFIGDVNRRFPTLPFSMSAFEDETMARVGVTECKRHELLHEYPVLHEREGQCITQFKYTILLLHGGTKRITGLPLGKLADQAKSALTIQDEDLKKLLATSANPKKAKKKKKDDEKKEKDEKA